MLLLHEFFSCVVDSETHMGEIIKNYTADSMVYLQTQSGFCNAQFTKGIKESENSANMPKNVVLN